MGVGLAATTECPGVGGDNWGVGLHLMAGLAGPRRCGTYRHRGPAAAMGMARLAPWRKVSSECHSAATRNLVAFTQRRYTNTSCSGWESQGGLSGPAKNVSRPPNGSIPWLAVRLQRSLLVLPLVAIAEVDVARCDALPAHQMEGIVHVEPPRRLHQA